MNDNPAKLSIDAFVQTFPLESTIKELPGLAELIVYTNVDDVIDDEAIVGAEATRVPFGDPGKRVVGGTVATDEDTSARNDIVNVELPTDDPRTDTVIVRPPVGGISIVLTALLDASL